MMTFGFWAFMLGIPSSAVYYLIAVRRLRKRGKPNIGALNPLMLYSLDWADYFMLLGVLVGDLAILAFFDYAGLIADG